MLLGQELKFKNKLCNLKWGTFFSAFPGSGSCLDHEVEFGSGFCAELPQKNDAGRKYR